MTALIVGACLAGQVLLHAQPEDTQSFLRTALHFSDGDLRHLAQGRAVVRTLETAGGRELAIGGAIRVAASPADYVLQLRDIVEFKRHEAVRQIGTFGELPRVEDISRLTLDEEHLDDLRGCRRHDCDVQLSADAIQRTQQVPWGTPDADAQANRLIRQILTELVTRYREQGDRALMLYEHERTPISVAKEFNAMIAAPFALLPSFPALRRQVTQHPEGTSSGAEDVIYWSKEDVGPKVVISVTHMAITPVNDGGPVVYAAASKQLYGSYFFDSSLGLTLLLRDAEPGASVLVYVNRSRIDELDGFLGGLKRAIIRSRGRAALEDTLVRIRTRLPARVRGAQ